MSDEIVTLTETFRDGVVVYSEVVNVTDQTVTVTAPGKADSTRPLTPEEGAQVDILVANNTAETNELTLAIEIQQNIDTLLLTVDSLNAITAKTNADINANPAAVIKDVAREAKTIARQTIRIARVLTKTTDTTNSGS